jgi:hypothetical protein
MAHNLLDAQEAAQRRDQWHSTYKKRTIGTVTDLPLRRDAGQAVADFRANIDVEVRVPVTVSEL